MNLKRYITWFLSVLALGVPALQATTALTYSNGDLLLGFHASSGTGATQDYVVNLGPVSNFTNQASAGAVSGLTGIDLDLTAVFGSSWHSRAELSWGISGTVGSFAAIGNDPAKTIYATKARTSVGTALTSAQRWTRAASATQGAATNKMGGLGNAFARNASTGAANQSTANNATALIQSTTDINSYASYQAGGSLTNAGPAPGISFAYFNPTIEGNFTNGTAGSVLELHRMAPGSGPGDFLGTFQLNNAGVLTFTPAPTTFSLSSSTASVSESATNLVVTVIRLGDISSSGTVTLNTTDGTAFGGTDFTAQSNVTVSFLASESSKTVSIPIANLAGVQGDRNFTVTISNATGGGQLGSTTQAVTIVEAQSAVAFTAATASVAETATKVSLTVNRTGNLSGASSVILNTADVSAAAGTDYTALSAQSVSFSIGDTSKTVDVLVANRTGINGSRTFTATLSGPSTDTVLGTNSVNTVTITDVIPADPGQLAFSAATFTGFEASGSDSTVTITVNRSVSQDGAVTVSVGNAGGGTATTSNDFTGLPQTLSWADQETGSKTFNLTIKPDSLTESAETILLSLSGATGGVALVGQVTATVKINDFDSAPPVLKLSSPTAGAKVTGAVVSVAGTANDPQGISMVEVSINGGSVTTATLGTPVGTVVPFTLSVMGEQGLNTLLVKAYDLQGNNVTISRTFTFFNNDSPEIAGNYNGLIVANETEDLALAKYVNGPSLNHNGLVLITLTTSGRFSGKVTMAGVTQSIKGLFLNNGTAVFGDDYSDSTTIELVKHAEPDDLSLGFLSLNLDAAGQKITGTITDESGLTTFGTLSNADQAIYSKNNLVPTTLFDSTKENGKYTAIFESKGVTNNGVLVANYPQGDGAATITLSSAGVVKIVGKLADGSAITYSNALSKNSDWPVFIQLYKNKGFITGNVAFDPTQTSSDATGSMKWFKPSGFTAVGNYLSGWKSGIDVDFAASKYLTPATVANPDTVLGEDALTKAAPINNITIVTSGLQGDTSNDAALSTTSKVVVGAATTGQTSATSLLMTFVSPTGAFSGSFTYADTTVKATFSGVVFQKTNKASGYFLYVPKTVNPDGQAESGAVGVAVIP